VGSLRNLRRKERVPVVIHQVCEISEKMKADLDASVAEIGKLATDLQTLMCTAHVRELRNERINTWGLIVCGVVILVLGYIHG
jgi:hypothetical protein